MSMAAGSNTRDEMRIPFTPPFNLMLEVDIRNPETIQSENAERFASQVNPCKTIGATSIKPAITPSKIPRRTVSTLTITPTKPIKYIKNKSDNREKEIQRQERLEWERYLRENGECNSSLVVTH